MARTCIMHAQQLAKETVVVGIVIAAIGLAVNQLPCRATKKWQRDARNLFLTGAAAHLLFEALALNAWYCKHGAACAAAKRK